MYPFIEIFGIKINTYWALIVISLLLMIFVNIFRAKRFGLNYFHAIIISILVNVFAIIGAYMLFKLESIGKDNPGFGLSFFGTVFFLPIFMYIVSLFINIPKETFLDYWSLTIPMELCLVRFGCYLAGCCLGIISENGVYFPSDPIGTCRLPVQLYECVFDLLIFAFLIFLEKKQYFEGILYPTFMVSYSLIRFILEFFRDTSKNNLGLSNGHIFSFIALLIGVVWIIYLLFLKKSNRNKFN